MQVREKDREKEKGGGEKEKGSDRKKKEGERKELIVLVLICVNANSMVGCCLCGCHGTKKTCIEIFERPWPNALNFYDSNLWIFIIS